MLENAFLIYLFPQDRHHAHNFQEVYRTSLSLRGEHSGSNVSGPFVIKSSKEVIQEDMM